MSARRRPSRRGRLRGALGSALLAGLLAQPFAASAAEPPSPGPRDTCPVCGMFVARYPEWIATAVHADGHTAHFDGAKDLFKYLLEPARYAPGRGAVERVWVTEYYGLTRIDAREAWYVVGSDVLGPMGHELVPLASRADAEEFTRDHKGRAILRYQEVDRERLQRIDQGRFD